MYEAMQPPKHIHDNQQLVLQRYTTATQHHSRQSKQSKHRRSKHAQDTARAHRMGCIASKPAAVIEGGKDGGAAAPPAEAWDLKGSAVKDKVSAALGCLLHCAPRCCCGVDQPKWPFPGSSLFRHRLRAHATARHVSSYSSALLFHAQVAAADGAEAAAAEVEDVDDGASSQLMVVLNEVAFPDDEEVRWDALHSYNILDTVRDLHYAPGGAERDLLARGESSRAPARKNAATMNLSRRLGRTCARAGRGSPAGAAASPLPAPFLPHFSTTNTIKQQEPEEAFDQITRLCKSLFRVPIAMVTFVDRDRVWLKSVQGLKGLTEVDRRYSICAWTLLSRHPQALVVPDLKEDLRFRDYPVVTGWPFVRFYAAAPLVGAGGHRVGTL